MVTWIWKNSISRKIEAAKYLGRKYRNPMYSYFILTVNLEVVTAKITNAISYNKNC